MGQPSFTTVWQPLVEGRDRLASEEPSSNDGTKGGILSAVSELSGAGTVERIGAIAWTLCGPGSVSGWGVAIMFTWAWAIRPRGDRRFQSSSYQGAILGTL